MAVSLIGKKVCDFTANAVLEDGSMKKDFNFYNHIENKNSLLFFYPMDFTFVCPSELIALNNRIEEFEKRNIKIVTVSCDSYFVHKAWRNTPTESGGIGNKINYVMVSDMKKNIMNYYGLEDDTSGVSYRGSIIIDKNKIIKAVHIHDFPIGRNIDEYIRIFDALFFHNKHGNVCQAGWVNGDDGINPSSDGISKFLSSKSKNL